MLERTIRAFRASRHQRTGGSLPPPFSSPPRTHNPALNTHSRIMPKYKTAPPGSGHREIDIKNYAKVEKIPGGSIEESRVLKGVMFSKDVVNPGRMRRRIERPRILLLDCPLEYKKGEGEALFVVCYLG